MPTSSDLLNRVAALLAAEREAAWVARRAAVELRTVLASRGCDNDDYRRASVREDDTLRAHAVAQVATDGALAALAGAVATRVEVAA